MSPPVRNILYGHHPTAGQRSCKFANPLRPRSQDRCHLQCGTCYTGTTLQHGQAIGPAAPGETCMSHVYVETKWVIAQGDTHVRSESTPARVCKRERTQSAHMHPYASLCLVHVCMYACETARASTLLLAPLFPPRTSTLAHTFAHCTM